MFIDMEQGHDLPFDPFKAIVAPRPIGWISTLSVDGKPNLAPYSFFNAICGAPPMVGFTSEGVKDTLNNILATGEFVVNLATRPLAELMNLSSARVGPDVDEFVLTGLTPLPSTRVRAPRVAETPAALECRLTQSFPLIDLNGQQTGRRYVCGQVVAIHMDDAFIHDGRFDAVQAQTIARCGYRDYVQVSEMFSMSTPKVEASA
jgi:flavin reductase (DIM6/NTAB) family NADH-FMN oxidoreductase RutF